MNYDDLKDIFSSDNPPKRTLILMGEITPENILNTVKSILLINEYDDIKGGKRVPIKLYLNTVGGNMYDGFALVDIIKSSKTKIHIYCYGCIMSMGLYIAVAGHKRFGGSFSTYMYHEGWTDVTDNIQGLKDDLAELERIQILCDNFLIKQTKLTKTILNKQKKLKVDWYISAEDAKKYNIIQEII